MHPFANLAHMLFISAMYYFVMYICSEQYYYYGPHVTARCAIVMRCWLT